MRKGWTWAIGGATVLLATAGTACSSEGACDLARLQAELDRATPGTEVEMAVCVVEGDLRVPPSVTLSGRGPEASAILGHLVLEPGTPATGVRGLSVESVGGAAIGAAGPGSLLLENVDVRLSAGIGLELSGALGDVHVENLCITGPFGSGQADELPPMASPEDGGALGIVARTEMAEVSIVDSCVGDVGPWGGLVVDTALTWQGGQITNVVGTSLLVEGGTANLDGLEIRGARQGVQPLPAYGAAFTSGADVTTARLTLETSEGVGLLVDGSTTHHSTLTARENRFGGVWVQNTEGFSLGGTGNVLEGNGLAALAIIDSTDISVADAMIVRTDERLSVWSERGAVQAADGVHLLGATQGVAFRNVVLEGHARVGLLVDAGTGDPSDVVFENVTVDAEGAGLGAIAQTEAGLVPIGTGWDEGIVRTDGAMANDAEAGTPLGTLGALRPDVIPIER